MTLRSACGLFIAAAVCGWAPLQRPYLQGGLYEVYFRLELPHLERWAVEKVALVCVPAEMRAVPIPILSGNMPFHGCPAKNLVQDGDRLTYEVACEGRQSARARASYVLSPERFAGRVAMTLGAKNMTMTEVQAGSRLGECDG